jgi:hypothetical protein
VERKSPERKRRSMKKWKKVNKAEKSPQHNCQALGNFGAVEGERFGGGRARMDELGGTSSFANVFEKLLRTELPCKYCDEIIDCNDMEDHLSKSTDIACLFFFSFLVFLCFFL